MKRIFLFLVATLFIATFAVASQRLTDENDHIETSQSSPDTSPSDQNLSITVNGITFTMVKVQGGTFTMGATSEQGSDAYDDENPAHRVTLSDYYIGQTEVTQALWQAVMGSNPSNWEGSNQPVEQVSYDDCLRFISHLNQLTGRHFRLPTEAEWEYAARGGNKSRGYKYAGSNNLGNVAWYDGNSSGHPYPVAQKHANELGLYDMTGNVWEWCHDWYGSYSSTSQTNPQGPSEASDRVLRGGSWRSNAWGSRVSLRGDDTPDRSDGTIGLRLALSSATFSPSTSSRPSSPSEITSDNSQPSERFAVNGITFTMVKVQGGTFTMGATSEQGSDAYDDEKPAHRVTLSDYYIGQTEVTQALWQAVMGSNPSNWEGTNLPVEQVSYDDCLEFISRLNQLTGRQFRLPTEAEWEYAARGGDKSRGYKYVGSNNLGDVAWYTDNSGDQTHPVAQKQANELGLYDMAGNVWEWCHDWYGSYSSTSQTNPQGPSEASDRVFRGGGCNSGTGGCRVSFRDHTPHYRLSIGLRLAL